ncbi:DUF1566 domain-containing protein [bacterium]|nr:DUF1566 domain-containing protein [bacterium]
MKKLFTVFAVTAIFLTVSCGGSVNFEDSQEGLGQNDEPKETGTLDGECYENRTCNEGLTCDEVSNTCMKEPEPTDTGEPECGNKLLEPGEVCDSDATECTSIDSGYVSGFAFCKPDCSGWDESYCWNPADPEPTDPDDTDPASEAESLPGRDPSTGCIWSKRYDSMKWRTAVHLCNSLNSSNYGGYSSGWHLPTISELRTLIKNCPGTETGGSCEVSDSCLSDSCWSNDCYCSCKENNGGYYSKLGDNDYVNLWSSSTSISDGPDYVWLVAFEDGFMYSDYKNNDNDVRCVRGCRKAD